MWFLEPARCLVQIILIKVDKKVNCILMHDSIVYNIRQYTYDVSQDSEHIAVQNIIRIQQKWPRIVTLYLLFIHVNMCQQIYFLIFYLPIFTFLLNIDRLEIIINILICS